MNIKEKLSCGAIVQITWLQHNGQPIDEKYKDSLGQIAMKQIKESLSDGEINGSLLGHYRVVNDSVNCVIVCHGYWDVI
jgi:hypothetical protein